MSLPQSKTKIECLVPYPPFLPVTRVQSRGNRKGFSHSWLVAHSSTIFPRGAWAGLAGDNMKN